MATGPGGISATGRTKSWGQNPDSRPFLCPDCRQKTFIFAVDAFVCDMRNAGHGAFFQATEKPAPFRSGMGPALVDRAQITQPLLLYGRLLDQRIQKLLVRARAAQPFENGENGLVAAAHGVDHPA